MKTFEVLPGHVVSYEEVGEPGTRPLVFLHAWGLDHSAWDQQIRRFSPDFRVIAVDLRGHGASAKPATGYTPDDVAGDVIALLDHLDLRDVSLVGWSFGAAVSVRVASTSERISRLVLVAPFPPKFIADDRSRYGQTVEATEALLEAERLSPRTVRRSGYAGMAKEPLPAEVVDWLYALSFRAPTWSAGQVLAEFVRSDFRDDLPLISATTLIVHGDADKGTPLDASLEYQQGIEGAVLVRFENSGHAPNLEEVDRFNDTLADFLSAEATSGRADD